MQTFTLGLDLNVLALQSTGSSTATN